MVLFIEMDVKESGVIWKDFIKEWCAEIFSKFRRPPCILWASFRAPQPHIVPYWLRAHSTHSSNSGKTKSGAYSQWRSEFFTIRMFQDVVFLSFLSFNILPNWKMRQANLNCCAFRIHNKTIFFLSFLIATYGTRTLPHLAVFPMAQWIVCPLLAIWFPIARTN